jgi:hypothetical protein
MTNVYKDLLGVNYQEEKTPRNLYKRVRPLGPRDVVPIVPLKLLGQEIIDNRPLIQEFRGP